MAQVGLIPAVSRADIDSLRRWNVPVRPPPVHKLLMAASSIIGPVLVTRSLRDTAERARAAEAELHRANAELTARNHRLLELDRLKDGFVAGISHELRSPLTPIVAYLELLLDEEAGPLTDEQREFLRVMERSALRLRRLVDDLLLLARIDAGGFALRLSEVDIGDLIEEVVSGAREAAFRGGVELVANVSRTGTLLADRERLSQMFDNLVANAVKFTPPGGKILVDAFQEDGSAVVEVADSGIGVPPGERQRIFDRFYRHSSSADSAAPGSGIGLTIVKAVAEAHGGTVSVVDSAGVGSTFRVEIPVDPASERPEGVG